MNKINHEEPLLLRLTFDGVASYSAYLCRQVGQNWTVTRVLKQGGSSEDAQLDEFTFRVEKSSSMLVLVDVRVTGIEANQAVSSKAEVLQSGVVVGSDDLEGTTTTGAIAGELRVKLQTKN